MYKEILRSIAGIDVFPVVSLCLFVGVFAIVLVRTMRADRARLIEYANLPLDDHEAAAPRGGQPVQERTSNRGATL